MTTSPFDQLSVLLLFTALAVYAAAFVSFTIDLARRSSEVREEESAGMSSVVAEAERITSANGGTATITRTRATTPVEPERRKRIAERLGVSFTILAFALHVGAVVFRGVAAGRVPWANMYEFSMTASAIAVGIFLLALLRVDLRFLGTVITGLVLILLGISTFAYRVAVSPLPPALQDYWLLIHVTVAMLATAFYVLGGGLAFTQLVQSRRERLVDLGGTGGRLRLLQTFPTSGRLENLTYRVNIIGFILWTFTLIAGAIWAEHAWGRFWGWDTKEVWTFIVWVIYAGYIHARATRGWRGTRSSWLALVGFAAVLFNFGVVNVWFHGLHSYSGLSTSTGGGVS
jgi:cytochrome c-type biogenesis protein CcsB